MYRYIIAATHVLYWCKPATVYMSFVGTKQPLVGWIDYYVVILSDLVAQAVGYIS
jgi:hypothetical protein